MSAYRFVAAAIAAVAVSVLSIPTAMTPASASGSVVPYNQGSPGTIIVHTSERRLYLVLGNGRALAYPVGVGKAGMQWSGRAFIESKRVRPAWGPPPDIKRENPRLPDVIPGGAPNNPMGVAALVLDGGKYAIHGTNNPSSIGNFASHGCIRMYNADITDLYERVNVGTQVIVAR